MEIKKSITILVKMIGRKNWTIDWKLWTSTEQILFEEGPVITKHDLISGANLFSYW